MDFSPSPKVVELQSRVMDFVRNNVIDAEVAFKKEMNALRAAGNPWQPTQTMETLKEKAKAAGLWNKPIVTRVEPLRVFYPAETYHQDFMLKNPTHPYIVRWDAPKVAALAKLYPGYYKRGFTPN